MYFIGSEKPEFHSQTRSMTFILIFFLEELAEV